MISLSLADKKNVSFYVLCMEMNKLYIIKKDSHQIAK